MRKPFSMRALAAAFVLAAASGASFATGNGSGNGPTCVGRDACTTNSGPVNTANGGAGGTGGTGVGVGVGIGGAGGSVVGSGNSANLNTNRNTQGQLQGQIQGQSTSVRTDVNNDVRNSNDNRFSGSVSGSNTNTNTNSGNATATGGNASATGGQSSSTSSASAAGGAGGAAKVEGSGNSANSNNSQLSVTVEGDEAQKRAPVSTAIAPALSSSTASAMNGTCFGSVSGGGQTTGIGISFGSTVKDQNCDHRYNVYMLSALGAKNVAIAYACQNIPGVQDAVKAIGAVCPEAPAQDKNRSAAEANAKGEPTDPIVRRRLGLKPLE